MRIYKFWSKYSEEVYIEGEKVTISAWGGSNESADFAEQDAAQRLSIVQERIKGQRERRLPDDYEVDIKEEVIKRIDEDNVVTRNRYGALVLNSTSTVFVDIDRYTPTFWEFFKNFGKSPEERMLAHIHGVIDKHYPRLGFRIYKTRNGYRLMVPSSMMAPRSSESKLMMKRFRADQLYASLCERQNCYRARLTPKPYRMRQRGIRVKYPERSPQDIEALNEWLGEYRAKSERFSTCHLIGQKGLPRESEAQRLHDRVCKVEELLRLA